MSPTADTTVFQSLLDDAVANSVAPGFQCVIFDRDSLIYNGVSGKAVVPAAETPDGKALKHENLLWLASCSKISMSIIILHIIERGLTKTGFSMKDLDSHEALIKVLPEFRHGSGSLVTKIIEGFEDKLGPDGRKVMKLRDAKGRVTLRMLLTHTAGFAYEWNHPLTGELFGPSDGSVPNFMTASISGDMRDIENPLVNEPDTAYHYGRAGDWLGQFAVRASGKNLRQLHHEILFQPLGVPPSEADLWISPSLLEARVPLYIRDSDKKWVPFPYNLYTTEGEPPKGKSFFGSGCIISSLQAYTKVLQAVLRQDEVLLSKYTWEMGMKDDLKPRDLKISKPAWISVVPRVASSAEEFAKSTAEDGAGVNLLQTQVALAPTLTGRPTGSLAWAGFANTYFFVDPTNGIGMLLGAQIAPFYDAGVVDLRDKLEAMVYKTLVD